MKNLFSHISKRCIPISALCLLLVGAILYQSGVFDIPFITRSEVDLSQNEPSGTQTPSDTIFSDGAVENPNAPTLSDSLIDAINNSSNLSDITGDSRPTDTTGGSDSSSGGKYDSFQPTEDYSGYKISYTDFSSSSVLAEITLSDTALPSAVYGGSKIKVEFVSAVDTTDGIPYSKREFSSATSIAVELYMGYIIIDNGESLTLFSSSGKKLGTFERMYFIPAYTRDSQSNPLFFISSEGYNKYYLFDSSAKAFCEAVYNDELENRGLYFDYTPDYGLSDNEYNRYNAIVNCIVEMTPEEAGEYFGFPITTAPDTTAQPETTAPETTAEETTAEETTAEDTTAEETTSEGAQEARLLFRAPRTEILSGYETAKALLLNTKSTANITAISSKHANYTLSEDGKTVFVEMMERRWAFDITNYMESEEYKNNPDDKKLSQYFKYYRLYNFQGGLCATVERGGIMSFTNISGENIISRDVEYYGQNNRKLLSSYREPLLKGIDSLGSLYFDRGYVLIRQVDIDSQFTDKLSGDYTYLVDKNGVKFNIPAGYDIVSYSDGVLLLHKDGYFGYYSTKGKWISQPIYTYARPFAEGLGVIGFSGSLKGVIDTEGNIVIPLKYDYISQVSSGIMALHNENGWKLIAKLEK